MRCDWILVFFAVILKLTAADNLEEQLYVSVLKCLHKEMARNLLPPKYSKGIQIIFFNTWCKWMESTNSKELGIVSDNAECASSCNKNKSTHTENNNMQSRVTLFNILNNSVHGKNVLEHYKKNGRISNNDVRKLLLDAIVDYYLQQKLELTTLDCDNLSKEIVSSFNGETKEYYYSHRKNACPRGKLYNKFHNKKSFLKKSVADIHVKMNQQRTESFNSYEHQEEEYIRALKFDNLSIEEIVSHYDKCRNTRLNQIKSSRDMKEVYANWPHYKQSYGYKLISNDFNYLYGCHTKIYEEFDTFFEKLLPVMEEKIKDLDSIKLFTQLNLQKNSLTEGTLRTYQRAGCDDDFVTLRCPPGTSISIQLAQYGASAPTKNLCRPRATQSSLSTISNNTSCLWPNALQIKWEEVTQGTWGSTVVEVCHKKRQCKFQSSPKTFGGDPCPGIRKYVEVAYKCRPYEFRSKVACQNEKVQLKCNPNSRVAVYSASFGRTEYESIQCPQPQGVPEETCLVSYATETVIQLCHGKRSCNLSADINTFGSPCRSESRMYLKVVYTCVPRKVLKEQYEGQPEPDELGIDSEIFDDDEFENYDAGNEFIRESAASPSSPNVLGGPQGDNLTKDLSFFNTKIPPHVKSEGRDTAFLKPYTTPRFRINLFRPSRVPAVQQNSKDIQADEIPDPNCTITVYSGEKTVVIGFISEWINAYTFVSQNQERFYLYLILSIAAAVVLCLVLLVGRLLVQRQRARREAKFHATTVADHSLPNGFTDDISEIDADIGLTTPLPVPTVAVHSPASMGTIAEVVRYPHIHTHTLRRPPPDNDIPRSLSSASNTQYYYG